MTVVCVGVEPSHNDLSTQVSGFLSSWLPTMTVAGQFHQTSLSTISLWVETDCLLLLPDQLFLAADRAKLDLPGPAWEEVTGNKIRKIGELNYFLGK